MRGGTENLRFLASGLLYLLMCEIGLRLLLITNRKSYVGFRLAQRAMTLDDPEHQSRGSLWIFWQFWAARRISRAKCAKINRDRQG